MKNLLLICLIFLAAGSKAQTPLSVFHDVKNVTVENHRSKLPANFVKYISDDPLADTLNIKSYVNEKNQFVTFLFDKGQIAQITTTSEELLPQPAWKYPYRIVMGEKIYVDYMNLVLYETKTPAGATKWAFYSPKHVNREVIKRWTRWTW